MEKMLSFCHKAPVEETKNHGWKCTACGMPCDLWMPTPPRPKVVKPKPKKKKVVKKVKKPTVKKATPKPRKPRKKIGFSFGKARKKPICSKCGSKIYPDAIKADWGELKVKIGMCPICREKKPLIPISEWK
jgi:hypothetical protein